MNLNKMTSIANTVFGKLMENTSVKKEIGINITREQVNALLHDIEMACKKHGLSFYIDYDQVLNVHEYEDDMTRMNLLKNGVNTNE